MVESVIQSRNMSLRFLFIISISLLFGSSLSYAAIEEVVVRAQKRAAAESIQDVPLAITALNEEAIENTFSVDITDVGRLAPNVHLQPVSTFPGFANFTIRGIGVNNSVRTVDPAVNIMVDGMVLGFQVGTILDTFDLESVEMLRGPQGILFGRNTTGGAVSLRTRRPDGEFGVRGKVTAGNFNRIDGALSLEGALVENKVFGKIAFLSRNRDGFFEDNNGGTFTAAPLNPGGTQPANPEQDQVDEELIVVKPTLVFQMNDAVELTLLGQYMHSDGGGSATQSFVPFDNSSLTQALAGYIPPDDKFEINHDLIGRNETTAWHLISELNWDLGHGTFTGIAGYRDISYDSDLDIDGAPFALVHFPNNEEEGEQFSLEARYASSFSDKYDFVIGMYYFDQEYQVTERRQVLVTRFFQGDFTHESDSWAAFFHGNYHVNEQLTLSFGGRYTEEDKAIDIIPVGQCTSTTDFGGCPAVRTQDSDSWNNFSPKAGIQYQWNEDTLLYASWTKGFRSGNYNGRATSIPAIGPTGEETVESYEAGIKTTVLDGRLRANLVGFYTEYDDIQRTILTTVAGNPVQRLDNAASATIVGIEAELLWTPIDRLTLEMNVGWTDASFDEFNGLDLTGDGVPDPQLAEDLEFDRVPEFTAYLAGTYEFNLAGVLPGDFAYRVSYAWRDEFFTDVNNTPQLAQDSAYGLLDMGLTYTQDNWRLALFGRNLTEEDFIDVASGAPGGFSARWGGVPRTWGAEFSFEY